MISGLSIRARLALAFAAGIMVVLALMAAFVYQRVSTELTSAIDNGLRSRSDDLVATISAEGPPPLSASDVEPLGAKGGTHQAEGSEGRIGREEGFSQILGPRGRTIATDLPHFDPVLSAGEARRALEGTVLIESRPVSGLEGDARIIARGASGGDDAEPVIAVVGASTDDRSEALAGLLGAFAIAAPFALVLSCGLGYLLAGRSLAPMEAMRSRAAGINLDRSDDRLPLPRADDEVRRLGATLNDMLDRIEGSLERERGFVSDASHELRTPLAILKTELELAGKPGREPEELRAALRSARDEVDRLALLADDLLVIARFDRGSLPINREDLGARELLERIAGRFGARARSAGRRIDVHAPAGLTIGGDVLRLEQALDNLVENALTHGEGPISLSAGTEGELAVLEVSDSGKGFDAGFTPLAFERFSRADAGRTGAGAGLGLAIVRTIARAHGGDAVIEPGPGTRVRISLPLG